MYLKSLFDGVGTGTRTLRFPMRTFAILVTLNLLSSCTFVSVHVEGDVTIGITGNGLSIRGGYPLLQEENRQWEAVSPIAPIYGDTYD